jgi:membrane protease YdiL (CAAX protease family)
MGSTSSGPCLKESKPSAVVLLLAGQGARMDIDANRGETEPQARPRKSLWRRIVHFPLVTLILAFLLISVAQAIGGLISFAAGTPQNAVGNPGSDLIFVVAATILVVLAYKLIVVRMGEQPRDDLPFDARARDAGLGFVEGALLFSAIVGVAALLGIYRALNLSAAEDWLPLILGGGIMAGVTEEILLRGVVFRWLEELGGSWVALVLSSLLFGFLHAFNPNATVISSISIAVAAGLLLGGAYMLTRNLWLPIGIHAGWNVSQGLVWDIPVSGLALDGWVESKLVGDPLWSGGAFGLEASPLTMIIAGAAGVGLIVLAGRRGNIWSHRWSRAPHTSNEAVRVDVDADPHALREA